MPPRIIPILARLRQEIAAGLSKETIEEACRQAEHRWRERVLDPATTIYLFLLQVLHGNTACQHVVHFGGWTFTDSAYCQARKRLPLAVYDWLVERTAAAVRTASDSARWLGHRIWVVDGSSFSMPDEPELQRHFGQPGNQRKGCGFPVAKWLALFDVATGMLLRSTTAPLRTHDMSQVGPISDGLEPGDVVLGDRGFCSYAECHEVSQKCFIGSCLRSSDLGLVIRMYCLGRRFTTRGSTRPRRDGLMTMTAAHVVPSRPISQRTASIKPTRSGSMARRRADSSMTDLTRLYARLKIASSLRTPSTVSHRRTSIFMLIFM
jgi:hypothetical protein